MLDRYITPLIKPALDTVAKTLVRLGVTANGLTFGGFFIGMAAAAAIALQAYWLGLVAIALSRLCDGLDGAVARQTKATDRGGFLDITLDFVFYASIPMAFAIANPADNALAAAVLLAAFVGTTSSFLAYAVMAAKRSQVSTAYPNKSLVFLGGLTEATETYALFTAMCIWPQHFAPLAYAFAAACVVTTATRVWWGYSTLD
jgi:phosphatidylglycerophosphate synthase